MYVEDKTSHRGPFVVTVTKEQTVGQLKRQVENEFEIPVAVQRWILGKELASDDNATLEELHVTTEGCPIFLYLVAPAPQGKSTSVERFKSQLTAVLAELKVSPESAFRPFSKLKGGEPTFVATKQSLAITSDPKGILKKKHENQKPREKIVSNFQQVPKNLEVVAAPRSADQQQGSPQKPSQQQGSPQKPSQQKTPPQQPLPQEVEEKQASIFTTQESEKVSPSSVVQIQHPPTLQHLVTTQPSTKACIENVSMLQSKLQLKQPQKEDPKPVEPEAPIQNEEPQPEPQVQKEETRPQAQQKQLQKQANLEEDDDYDYCKTLRPEPTEWECIMCTLLNPQTSKVCAVCATVRQFPPVKAPRRTKSKAPQPHYLQLVNLDSTDVVSNTEPFECLICFVEINPGEGVTLRECLHQFCKACLSHTVEYCEEAEVKCPYRDSEYSCDIALQDREVKALVTPDVYDRFLAKSIAQAENKIDKSFHCKTPDCKGWCIFEDNVNHFRCPVCKNTNCLTCQVSPYNLVKLRLLQMCPGVCGATPTVE